MIQLARCGRASAVFGAERIVLQRVQSDRGRHKKSTIIALARKMLVALWKYVGFGVVIDGAVMKAA